MNRIEYWSLDCDVLGGPRESAVKIATAQMPEIAKDIADALNATAQPSDPECLEGPPRTREEMAAEWRELNRVAPTAGDKLALMLGLPEPWGFRLWQHLHHEHGLTLLESQIADIVRLAREIDTEPDPFAGRPELPLDHERPAYCPPRYVHGVCGTNPCSCDTTLDTPPP